MLKRALSASLDCRLKDRIELLARDDECTAECLVAGEQQSIARELLVELVEDLLEVRLGERGCHRVVEGARLLVERQALAGEHADAGRDCGELPLQVVAAQPLHLIGGLRHCADGAEQRLRLRRQIDEGNLDRFRLLLPLRRTVVSIDVIGIVLAERQHQLHVTFGDIVHG